MLKRRTVLVLGAGASAPFGFPTGAKLSQMVWGIRGNGIGLRLLKDLGYSDREIDDFCNQFYFSGRGSIDAFLEHRPDLLEIGKHFIAILVGAFEQEVSLFSFERNWLRYVYGNLNAKFDEFEQNQLSFITYNYDRSVEHFLFTAFQQGYKAAERECEELAKKIPVIHLHGSLGNLSWQKGKTPRLYVAPTDGVEVRAAAREIKIIHEDITDGRDADFDYAKRLLKAAERIVIMGFGYDKTNMERLGMNASINCDMIGSCVGMSNREKEVADARSQTRLALVEGDCFDIVREHIQWE